MDRSTNRADVLIIGGGAIGACIALELARAGREVVLIERHSELAGGCSAGNAGLLSPNHGVPLPTPEALRNGPLWMVKRESPLYLHPRFGLVPWLARFTLAARPRRARAATRMMTAFSLASLDLHAGLADEGLHPGFRRSGIINTYQTSRGFQGAQRQADVWRAAGLDVRLLTGAEAQTLEPALTERPVGAAFFPQEALCEPRAFVQSVGRAAQAAGADVRTGVEALGFLNAGSRVDAVETTAGAIRVSEVVFASGSWTRELARRLRLRLPVEGGKGYHVDFQRDIGAPERPVFLQEARVAITPLDDRNRVSGTLELAGLDMSVDRRRLGAVVSAAERNLAFFAHAPRIEVWRGLRPCAPDGLPLIGRTARWDNVVVATGHAMTGIALAPVTARAIRDLMTGRPPAFDLRPFHPDRFRLGRVLAPSAAG
jgi:D-amino-acid dehydrogenase